MTVINPHTPMDTAARGMHGAHTVWLNPAPPPREAGVVQGLVLTSVQSLSVMGIILITPILPAMQAHFVETPHAVALVRVALTLPALCVFLLSPYFGSLADRISGRRMLLVATPFYALLGTAPLYVHSLGAIVLTRVGVGVSEAVLVAASTALIGQYFHGAALERWFATQTAVAAVSAILLFLCGGLLGDFGWRVPFAVYGSSLLIFVLVMCFTWEVAHRIPKSKRRMSFPWRPTIWLYGLSLFVAILFYIVPIQLPFILAMHGITMPSRIGLATAFGSVGVPLGSAFFAWKARWRLMSLLLVGFVLLGAGMLGVAVIRDYYAIAACVFVNQFGSGVLLPALLTRVVNAVPVELRGRGSGGWMSCLFLGQFISPLIVLGASSMLAGPPQAVAFFGVISLAAGFVMLFTSLGQGRRPAS